MLQVPISEELNVIHIHKLYISVFKDDVWLLFFPPGIRDHSTSFGPKTTISNLTRYSGQRLGLGTLRCTVLLLVSAGSSCEPAVGGSPAVLRVG